MKNIELVFDRLSVDWTPEEDEAFNEVEKQSNLGKQILQEIKPKREWVGLTDEEIIDVNLSKVKRLIDDPIVCDTDHNIIELGKAIEAKLKEKNT